MIVDINHILLHYFHWQIVLKTKTQENFNEITVSATDDNIYGAMLFIDNHLKNFNCNEKAQQHIDVSVEELFLNIFHYAYAPEIGKVTIKFEHKDNPNRAIITFIDSGKQYNPLSKPDQDTTLNAEERPIGGLGIYTVKNMMDDIHYEFKDGKNILTIEKIFKNIPTKVGLNK